MGGRVDEAELIRLIYLKDLVAKARRSWAGAEIKVHSLYEDGEVRTYVVEETGLRGMLQRHTSLWPIMEFKVELTEEQEAQLKAKYWSRTVAIAPDTRSRWMRVLGLPKASPLTGEPMPIEGAVAMMARRTALKVLGRADQ